MRPGLCRQWVGSYGLWFSTVLCPHCSHMKPPSPKLVKFSGLRMCYQVACSLLLQFYPMWIAPNVLTFAGFLLIVLQFFIFTYYDNYFYASDDTHTECPPLPRSVWLIAALCMFWAHQLGMLLTQNCILWIGLFHFTVVSTKINQFPWHTVT